MIPALTPCLCEPTSRESPNPPCIGALNDSKSPNREEYTYTCFLKPAHLQPGCKVIPATRSPSQAARSTSRNTQAWAHLVSACSAVRSFAPHLCRHQPASYLSQAGAPTRWHAAPITMILPCNTPCCISTSLPLHLAPHRCHALMAAAQNAGPCALSSINAACGRTGRT